MLRSFQINPALATKTNCSCTHTWSTKTKNGRTVRVTRLACDCCLSLVLRGRKLDEGARVTAHQSSANCEPTGTAVLLSSLHLQYRQMNLCENRTQEPLPPENLARRYDRGWINSIPFWARVNLPSHYKNDLKCPGINADFYGLTAFPNV